MSASEQQLSRIAAWARAIAPFIQKYGIPLADAELKMALEFGIQEAQKIQVLSLRQIDLPGRCGSLVDKYNELMDVRGMCLGHELLVLSDHAARNGTINGLLKEVRLFEASGSLEGYLRHCMDVAARGRPNETSQRSGFSTRSFPQPAP